MTAMALANRSELVGGALCVSGFFVAYFVSEALGGITPAYARAVGCATAGVLICVIDLGFRKRWAEGDGWARYVLYGPRVAFVPAWVAGLFFLLAAIAVAGS